MQGLALLVTKCHTQGLASLLTLQRAQLSYHNITNTQSEHEEQTILTLKSGDKGQNYYFMSGDERVLAYKRTNALKLFKGWGRT